MQNIKYELKNLEQLVGGKITEMLDAGDSFGFAVTNNRRKYVVYVDRDEEANGPGHLTIERITTKKIIIPTPETDINAILESTIH